MRRTIVVVVECEQRTCGECAFRSDQACDGSDGACRGDACACGAHCGVFNLRWDGKERLAACLAVDDGEVLDSGLTRPRNLTLDEVVVESADRMMRGMEGQAMAGIVVGSQILPGGSRSVTVWRFINCPDPTVGAASLRQVADMVDGKLGEKQVLS